MYLLNYSLDNLSLMALTIATGFVVDDAIAVVENVTRYLEQGVSPLEAALRGAQEIGFTVLSDQRLAGRRLYSHPIDGWYRRATIPRICRDPLDRDSRIPGYFPDHHAHAGAKLLEAGGRARTLVPRQRAHLRSAPARL